MTEPTCGTCKHWHKKPDQGINNIGQPKRGVCRYGPPHATTLPNPNGINTFSSYPDVPENFPACSQHDAKLEIG